MAGGLLLLQGYKPGARWGSGDLWRQWAAAIARRAPNHQLFLQKVKAHVDESHFARGLISPERRRKGMRERMNLPASVEPDHRLPPPRRSAQWSGRKCSASS